MATEFRCEKCGKGLLSEEPPGSRVACPTCGNEIAVPVREVREQKKAQGSVAAPPLPGREGAGPEGASIPSHGTENTVAGRAEVISSPPAARLSPEVAEVYVEEGTLSDRAIGILTAIMPWAVSLVFHAGIFLVLFFSFAARTIVTDAETERIIIPDARLSENPGGIIDPGAQRPDLQATGPRLQAKSHEYQRQPVKDMLAEVGVGRGGGSGSGSGGGGEGGGGGDIKIIGIGVGSGGGPGSAYGLSTGSGGQGPRAAFYGSGGNAYKVCYVIDRSGSLLDTFDYLRDELKKSIRELVAQQQFHVIFFSAGRPEEIPPGKLVYATPANKEKAFKYLDTVVPSGQTQPGPALERAFACKPELVYFMTDGDFDAKVLDLLRRLNRDKKVKINTLSFVFKPGEALLKQIAAEHGGRYKHVNEDDLGK